MTYAPKARLQHAQAALGAAAETATTITGRPGDQGEAYVDPAVLTTLHAAPIRRPNAPVEQNEPHVPLGDVRVSSRLLDEAQKLLTHRPHVGKPPNPHSQASPNPVTRVLTTKSKALIRQALTLTHHVNT